MIEILKSVLEFKTPAIKWMGQRIGWINKVNIDNV